MLGGKLVHQTSDEYGTIEVVDYIEQLRAMHFGNKTQQSTCLICNPYFLIHKYAQAMTLPLCWLRAKRVLVLGLGAGSIVKHLYIYHPELIIDAVELRPAVTDIATEYFLLPEPDERLNIYHNKADYWLSQNKNNNYDLIIVDVFLTTISGTDITTDLSSSLYHIHEKLSQTGVAVFNYLGDKPKSYPGYEKLSSIFDKKLSTIDIESTNSIILASKTMLPKELKCDDLKKLAKISTIPYQEYFNLLQS